MFLGRLQGVSGPNSFFSKTRRCFWGVEFIFRRLESVSKAQLFFNVDWRVFSRRRNFELFFHEDWKVSPIRFNFFTETGRNFSGVLISFKDWKVFLRRHKFLRETRGCFWGVENCFTKTGGLFWGSYGFHPNSGWFSWNKIWKRWAHDKLEISREVSFNLRASPWISGLCWGSDGYHQHQISWRFS